MRFTLRLLINAAALWAASRVVPGVTYAGGWMPLLGVALVFGVANALIRPVATVLRVPIVIVALGLSLLIVNGAMLWLAGALSEILGRELRVRGLRAAFWGAIVVSVVSGLLSHMVTADEGLASRPIQ